MATTAIHALQTRKRFMDTATMRKRGSIKTISRQVCVTSVKILRSGVPGNRHAPIWNSGRRGDASADCNRLNGTFRERLASLARRTRGLARTVTRLEAGMWLVGAIYNFCTPHTSLRAMAGKAGRDRTPAMAAGITRQCWSVRELRLYHVPPPQWTPPQKRGRRSRGRLALIAQWCQ